MEAPLVYVVEDDEFIREAISGVLEEGGYKVEAYRNGREAAEALDHEGSPSLILLDWMMPEMSGEEFILSEQERMERNSIPVVVVSAVADRIGDIPCVQEKMSKPMDVESLLDLVERNCGRRMGGPLVHEPILH